MSVMGFFFYPTNTKQASRIYSLFLTLIGVITCGVLATIIFNTPAHAADAAWANSNHTAISYGGKMFSGPKTNDKDPMNMNRYSGWQPTGTGQVDATAQDGATYFQLNDEAIIWFPKGTSYKSASSANYSKLENRGEFYITPEDIKQITLGADQTGASLSAVKRIYKDSISQYITSECSKSPFTTPQLRNGCINDVNKRFDACWNGQINDNSFTFNSSKPGNSVNTINLSSCIVDGTDVGSASQYRDLFAGASSKANEEGSNAFNDAAPTGDLPEEGEGESSCQIDGIGWIVCPALTFSAGLVDAAYGFVSSLLKVQPLLTTGETKPVYDAWKMMRNLANIAFVIAFLVIIFSQLTSFGVSNYGVKKLLPRIIMAAILVNASYWVCAIAVDVSNILGASLREILDASSDTIYAPDTEGGIFSGQNPWVNATAVILAGGVSLYIGLSAFLPAIIAALAAIVIVFIVLTLRQALIILLIVIAPLAFVALLLPNTESWFKKWRALFQTLLLMYPIIAVIFGASAFASKIVMESSDDIAIQVMGAAISILPLAITPVVMKTAGGLLNRFGGMINNPNKGPFDRLRKGASSLREGEKTRMRGKRINPESGRNAFTRNWHRASGLGTRTGLRFQARGDRNKARVEAAEAGFMSENNDALEASKLRMAASAANSARQSQSLQGIDTDSQLDALGVKNRENHSLQAAISNQVAQGEKQAVSEIEAQLMPQSASQLGQILENAIKNGNTIEAQAAQNRLSTMGNKGADVIAQSIQNRESSPEGNENWVRMRTELARNMSGGVMEKNEALKNWAVSTEVAQENGKDILVNEADGVDPVTGKNVASLEGHMSKLLTPTPGQGLSVDKFRKQTPIVQKQLLDANAVSAGTLKSSLSDTNIGTFDPSVVEKIKTELSVDELKQQPPNIQIEQITNDQVPKSVMESASKPSGSHIKSFDQSVISAMQSKLGNQKPTVAQQPNTTLSQTTAAAPSTQQASESNPTILNVPHDPAPSTGRHAATTASSTTQNITVNDNRTVNGFDTKSVPLSGRRSATGQYTNPKNPIPESRASSADYLPPQTPNSDPANIPPEFFK